MFYFSLSPGDVPVKIGKGPFWDIPLQGKTVLSFNCICTHTTQWYSLAPITPNSDQVNNKVILDLPFTFLALVLSQKAIKGPQRKEQVKKEKGGEGLWVEMLLVSQYV